MDSIAIFNQKGGVGKTTSVVNFAACLEKEFDSKVLVVDCDSQCNASSYLLTFTDTEETAERTDKTIEDYINGSASLVDVMNQVIVPFMRRKRKTNIYAIRGTRDMDFLDMSDDIFQKLIHEAEEEKFDYVIFDCPANLTQPTLVTLSAVRFVLIPITADIYCLSGYDMLLDNVNNIRATTNINLQILGIFFNNLRSVRKLDRFMYVENLENMDQKMFKTKIRDASEVPLAGYMGVPLPYFRQTSDVSKDYIKLMKEIRSRIKKIKKGA